MLWYSTCSWCSGWCGSEWRCGTFQTSRQEHSTEWRWKDSGENW